MGRENSLDLHEARLSASFVMTEKLHKFHDECIMPHLQVGAPSGAPLMKNAIQLLTDDHKKIKSLLEELANTSTRAVKKRAQLLDEVATMLKIHTTIEEEIFYPAFKQAGNKDDAKTYFEAMEEHRAAGELVLPDLMGTKPDSEQFSGRAKVLKELVVHHADEEEEGMFKRAKSIFDKAALDALGERMQARKAQMLGE
ncbi:hemerythrin domain-containing protein [Rhodanobacter sp. 7MK24]|uniref:hemerythrin domain-containing protein n=1 Tax=Rhodanobacter sp. 7MK24 TaxID=2775922 RepID=UPI001CE172C2|nr:hemerythrin domain-containing protein [Rhodanobacter sp. 7MK24]